MTMIYVMLPAYNEETALPLLLDSYSKLLGERRLEYRVVIVDDGSVDRTAAIAERYAARMPLVLLRHGINKGLGAAMRTGLSHIAKISEPTDLVVTMDADNTHNPEVLFQMAGKIEEGADVVIASRYEAGGKEVGLAIHRKILSQGASFLLDKCFGVEGAKDYTCGYRMYRSSVIKNAFERYGDQFIVENSFVCMAEILIKTAYLPAKVAEVPLVLRYDLKAGMSKMRKIKTIIRYVRFIIREKKNHLRPALPVA
jgi:dolichol-phosphate mannosyltransferase